MPLKLKGRHWLMLWIIVFLVTTIVVVARQASAYRVARRLHDLQEKQTTLESRRADLEHSIRDASSRRTLVPVAERLGLHQPSDSEYKLLPLGTASAADQR